MPKSCCSPWARMAVMVRNAWLSAKPLSKASSMTQSWRCVCVWAVVGGVVTGDMALLGASVAASRRTRCLLWVGACPWRTGRLAYSARHAHPPDVLHTARPLVLHYTVRSCPQGQVLVAATGQGIAAVLLGDDKASLVQELAQRYPQAQLETGGTPSAPLERSGAGAAGPPRAGAPPAAGRGRRHGLSAQGLGGALRRIPGGQTCTYTQLAQAHGPTAGRARRGQCLRGQPGGGAGALPPRAAQRWRPGRLPLGLARKQQLLAQEAA